ncbi:MAG: transposase [Desulfatiglandales bacterium]
MSDENVHKDFHGAWHIHCHIVFPVNYRKAIFDTEVTTIIMETAEAITEGYAIEIEAIGTDKNHIHLLCDVATVGERANRDTVEQYVQKQGYPKAALRELNLFD